jgi:hypothetical protein
LQKDYQKRIQTIAQIEKQINSRQDSISGSVVALWFYNTMPGNVGYEKGKEIAFKKISTLYTAVKNKKLTMKQAAQAIQQDSSLEQVDKSYKSNALLEFKADPKYKISFDSNFDVIIRKLQPGQVSELYLAKDKNYFTGKMVDAVYMFAQVTERKANGVLDSFDDWYARKEEMYEITTY